MTPTESRETILSRIRSAKPPGQDDIAQQYAAIPRHYIRDSAQQLPSDRLELFVERLREYDAGVHHATPDSIAAVVTRVLRQKGKRRMAIPHGLPAAWLPPGFEFIPADHLSPLEIDRLDGVLTACTLAIALTGSIVLQNAPAQGPRALSLVPDYHLCVLFAHQVVGTVPEAFARLAPTAKLATTFISGPSATADIEMTRIKGVHGPRFLDVILVE